MNSVTAFRLRPEDAFLLKPVGDFAKKKKIKLYIVGGYLRDIILKREKANPDIDFCLRGNAIAFGRALARELRAGFVVLDKEHGSCRLVKRSRDKAYTLDFTDFRGRNLKQDLLHRDFTINSLAIELEQVFKAPSMEGLLIDPYGGRRDLKSELVRLVNNKGFDEDPLRILRAFSLSCIFGFKIDKEAIKLIKAKRRLLSGVSYERIRDELFKIFDMPQASSCLQAMDRLQVLKVIIPEIKVMRGVKQGPYHHLDIWMHSLETVRQLEILIQEYKNNRDVREYLDEIISGERKRRALMKLGALLHDIGKPKAMRHEDGKTKFHGHERIGSQITEVIARRSKLSNDELDALRKMVFWHLRPGYLGDNEKVTPRAAFRYFRDTAREAVSVLLISIADQRSTRGPLTTEESRAQHERIVSGLIREYFRRQKEKKAPRLVTGDDLIKEFKLTPSPLIGKILSALEELQAIGKVKTRAEALKAAKTIIRRN